MYPDVIDLISESESEPESVSVNGDSNSIDSNKQRDMAVVESDVVRTRADKLRQLLRNEGFVEIDASSIKDSIYNHYASNGEVWNFKTKKSGQSAIMQM